MVIQGAESICGYFHMIAARAQQAMIFLVWALLAACSVPSTALNQADDPRDATMRSLVCEALAELEVQPSEMGLFMRATPAAAWQVDAAEWAAAGFRLNEMTEAQLRLSIHAMDEHPDLGEPDFWGCDICSGSMQTTERSYCFEVVERTKNGHGQCTIFALSDELKVKGRNGWRTVCALRDGAWQELAQMDREPVILMLAQYFQRALPSLPVAQVEVVHTDAPYRPATTGGYHVEDYGKWHPAVGAFVPEWEFDWLDVLPSMTNLKRPLLVGFFNLRFSFRHNAKGLVCWSDGESIQRMFIVTFGRTENGIEIIRHEEYLLSSSN